MPIYHLNEFLKLSAALNYNLTPDSWNRYNLLKFIMGKKRLHPDDESQRCEFHTLMEALNYLFEVYNGKRRRLGPMAILHPLRAAAIFSREVDSISLTDILTMLFHDVPEDISPHDHDNLTWREMEAKFNTLFDRLSEQDENDFLTRLDRLTRRTHESYYQYIDRLLSAPRETSKLVRIKLADRLDNTLDMRILLQDPIEGIDCFKIIFQIQFMKDYKGYQPEIPHQSSKSMNGAKRSYQLFKNIVLMSLIRKNQALNPDDKIGHLLFDNLAQAGLMEAQRNFIHLIGYHCTNLTTQNKLLMEAMQYCYQGRGDLATKPSHNSKLDGLFAGYFGFCNKKKLYRQLDILYADKELMLLTAISFIVIFQHFIDDQNFYVRGISSKGILPE